MADPKLKAAKPKGMGKPGTGSARAVSVLSRVKTFNAWREQFNPLVGLDMKRARTLLEFAQRGDFADLQWTYKFMEERFPALFALIERCTSPLLEMEWTVTPMEEDTLPEGATPEQAAKQAKYLSDCYGRIRNLEDAIEHISMAKFRGYAHLQLHDENADGEIDCFEILDQWNFVRKGLHGNWFWNPDALQTGWQSLPKENEIKHSGEIDSTEAQGMDRAEFIIRDVKRPVNPISLLAYIRWSMGKKDYAGFIEIFGIPGGVVIGPPNVPFDKESAFQTAAADIAQGGSGYIPHGGDYKANDAARGVNPFKEFLRGEVEDVVLTGTGGLLTMLTESGSGTLAGEAHTDTFNKIARSEAKKISAVFQRDFDKQMLAAEFENHPVLAYFELKSMDETAAETLKFKRDVWKGFMSDGTVADILANQTDLKQLTKDVDLPTNEEYTDPYVPVETQQGRTVTGKLVRDNPNGDGKSGDIIGAGTEQGPAPELGAQKPAMPGGAYMRNRRLLRNRSLATAFEQITAKADDQYAQAQAEAFQPLRERLTEVLQLPNFAEQTTALRHLQADLPGMLKHINASPESATILEEAMNAALMAGVEQGAQQSASGSGQS